MRVMSILATFIFSVTFAHAQEQTALDTTYTLVTGTFGFDAVNKRSFPNRKSNGHSYALYNGLDVETNPSNFEKSVSLVAGDESFFLTCSRERDENNNPTERKYGFCSLRLVVEGASEDLNPSAKLLIRGHLAKTIYTASVKNGTVIYKTGATLVKLANLTCTKLTDAEKTTSCEISGVQYTSETLDSVFKDTDRVNRILKELGL